jgi:hypothetical protein
MKIFKTILVIGMVCSFMAVAIIGCEKKGPAEEAGKKIDEAVDSVKDAAKE